ncbi:hypothetical protein SEA_AMETHYST_37 [Streptomyces phage Amethyst]|uniref:Uncharacterized protein n=1 Tax=Streptomyces phage Amethyst TaxID=2041205 RepID=A0A291LH10_9CAUD|nr:hypothetical protein KGG83_gp37 [Streptomyces phage Amethyst]ATI18659.1 hypothetical protein SEA_AMETHYST_37 [Streptomyces phage Amethyst]
MIRFMGWEMTQAERDQVYDEMESFFAYNEDPDSDLELILAVEKAYEVTHP